MLCRTASTIKVIMAKNGEAEWIRTTISPVRYIPGSPASVLPIELLSLWWDLMDLNHQSFRYQRNAFPD